MYLGWARGGAAGAALVGLAFVLPSFLMVLAIALLYLRFGGLPWMQGAFYGIGAAVIAIIARSAVKLTRLTLGADRLLWALFAAAALVTAWTESEIVWVFLGAGLLTALVRALPGVRLSRAALALGFLPSGLLTGLSGQAAAASTLWRLGAYFAEAGAFVFGSGLAIVPFLHAGVVREFHWLDERQFLDAVAVAMITPGPVVITVGFIGYLVAGLTGAVIAALGTFLPCYLFTVIPAPHFKRLSQNRAIKAFVDGVTAAATGAIAGAVFVLGRRALVDVTTCGIALAALVVLVRVKRVPEPLVIAGAGVMGVLMMGPPSSTVVFVCEHGSAKSLVAASLFDRMAKERGLNVRAVSRGMAPDEAVPPAVVRALGDEGFDVSTFRPRGIGEADLRGALRAVAIGVEIGDVAAKAGARMSRWDDIPPVSASYPEARAAIESRLMTLLEELERDGVDRSGHEPARLETAREDDMADASLMLFGGQKAGEAPRGMTCGLTGKGNAGVWTLREEADAPSRRLVLAQTDADPTGYRFPHCVVDGTVAKDLTLSVRFKPVSGRQDRAGGLVFRYRDPDNYYVVRANALEGNVVLYKLENGKRTDLRPVGAGFSAYGRKAKVPSGAWSELRVVVSGSLFDVELNGEALFRVEDATFTDAGRFGVWTKADSVTYFDDLKVAPAK